MTFKKLFLNRFIAIKDESIMYDQIFHKGINVIRGEHSVGKSTLLDLIFFSLGGELKDREWKYPVNSYTKVVAEVNVGAKTFTLIRGINTTKSKTYIDVYGGSFDDSLFQEDGWLHLGPVRSKNKMSFSEFFFEVLGWEQSITSDNSSLTMHQILRLLYLSQSSDSTKIFRSEIESRYDSASTREAIGDFILGLDDLSSYETRQQIFKIKRSVDSIKSDIKSYKNILQIDDSCNIQDYNDAINNKRIEIRENISNKNNELSLASQFFSDDFTKNINEISQNIADITIKIKQLQEKKVYINSEISDCILFSKSLIFRLKSLKESKSTFSAIGAMSFTFCPSCYSSVKESNIDDCKCALCKNELPKHNLEEKYTEVLAELKYQQRQNENTIAKLKISFEKVTSELSQLNGLLRENESKLRNYSSSTNDRELVIEKYSNIISKLESELEEKIEQKNTFMRIDELVKEEEDKSKLLVNLEKKLKKNSINNKDRRFTVLETISNKAKKLLELDLGNECDFKEASKLSDEINFCKDEWSIGGRVVFSDSSNVIKKSSLQIAMLFCSLNDIKARLPGFMMLDFECGDLNESRSHRFQKNLVDTFADSKDFQIIITTSKVCKELNNDHYGIGEYYDVGQYIFPV